MSDSTDEKTIGEIIAAARRDAGLSLRSLASQIEINYSYLADIEKSRRAPSEKVLDALSRHAELKLDFDFLMAHSGRLGAESEQYLKAHPKFGRFIRSVARRNFSDAKLDSLIKLAENNQIK